MAPPVKVPNKTQMRRYLSRGLTQQEIVEAWEADSGYRVSRSAIAMAIERYDLKSAHPRPTYPDLLPWVIQVEHRNHIDARMLRLEGRRRSGQKLHKQEQRWLDQWKHELFEVRNAVVHYEKDTDEGFFWIPRTAEHGDDLIDRSNAVKPEGRVPASTAKRAPRP
jgi:hypothetical protein